MQLPKDGQPDAGLTKDYANSGLHRFKKPGSKNYQNIYPPSPTLHLSNIPSGVEEEDLKKAFLNINVTVQVGVCWLVQFNSPVLSSGALGAGGCSPLEKHRGSATPHSCMIASWDASTDTNPDLLPVSCQSPRSESQYQTTRSGGNPLDCLQM